MKGSDSIKANKYKQNLHISINLNRYIYILVLLLIPLGIFSRGFGLDMIILTFGILSIFMKKGKQFLRDWLLFLILFWLYETTRGFADNIANFLHRPLLIEFPIKADLFLFGWLTNGQNLSVWLQNIFPPENMPHIFLILLFFFYTMFYWYWAGVGFFLWLKDKNLFYKYMRNLLLLSFCAAIIYAIFPSAPPWYASMKGYLPPLNRIMWSDVFPNTGISYIHFWDQNYFAALPSLHFSWPLLAGIYLIKFKKVHKAGKSEKQETSKLKNKLLNILPYVSLLVPLIILFAIVYGAEHYMIDAITGGLLVFVIEMSNKPKNYYSHSSSPTLPATIKEERIF